MATERRSGRVVSELARLYRAAKEELVEPPIENQLGEWTVRFGSHTVEFMRTAWISYPEVLRELDALNAECDALAHRLGETETSLNRREDTISELQARLRANRDEDFPWAEFDQLRVQCADLIEKLAISALS